MFHDRHDAGERLAERLEQVPLTEPLVVALPRGGVPVAVPIAQRLRAPLDLALVRKIGVPGSEELAAGAIMAGATGEEIVYNDEVLAHYGLRRTDLAATIASRRVELAERQRHYLRGRAPMPVAGRTVILVDDGIATGMTVRAALQGLRQQGPARIILAVPVAPAETLAQLRPLVDSLICLEVPQNFMAVGQQYRNFAQVSDGEVLKALDAARPDGPETETEER